MTLPLTIGTQTELNMLYMIAWGEQYISKAHYDRCAEMMHFTRSAEYYPDEFDQWAAKAIEFETNFIKYQGKAK